MFDKIQTNNTMMDSMVYNLKILVSGTILKDQELADLKETVESLRNSDLYMSCIDGSVTPELFVYSRQVLLECGLSEEDIILSEGAYDKLPSNIKPLAFEKMKEYYVSEYIERNNYYRMLNGLPDYGVAGISISDRTISGVDTSKMLHEMNPAEIAIVEALGIIKELYETTGAKYLLHLSDRRIDFYKARKAVAFGTLYIPNIEDIYIMNKYKTKLELNRVFTIKTIYSEAYKYGSDHYDKFIAILIKVQAMSDTIAELPDMLIKRDFFDNRTIKDMFESYGVEYFEDIPKKYQLLMLKNLNSLIKNKSSSKNIVDICSLFGFNDIDIFKYYLLKDRKKDENGDFVFVYSEDPENPGNQILKDKDNYDLKFIKVPLDKSVDDYLRNPKYHYNYSDLTSGDRYWIGDQGDAEIVYEQIVSNEFNHVISKYMSIDSIYDMSKLTFEICYFFNMIFSNIDIENNLILRVKYIDQDKMFRMTDIICYLYVLMFESIELVDTIIDTNSQVLAVKGFNFEANMSQLSTYVRSKGYTLEQLGVSGYSIPPSNILSYNQMLDIFIKNRNIYNHVVKQLTSADNKVIYDIYKSLYDALFVTRVNNSVFYIEELDRIAHTYTEYLEYRDPLIYNHIIDMRNLSGSDKHNRINETINELLFSLEDAIDTSSLNFIFTNIPSLSSEILKGYIYKVINFFKSYKVELTSINTVYKFDDMLDNKVSIIDQAWVSAVQFSKSSKVITRDERLRLFAKVSKRSDMTYTDYYNIFIKYLCSEDVDISEEIILKLNVVDKDIVDFHFKDKFKTKSITSKTDSARPNDHIFISYY